MQVFYSVFLCFLVILINLASNSTSLNTPAILVLVVAIAHPLVSGVTSMTLQGIKALRNNKDFRAAPQSQVTFARFYLFWFRKHPLSILMSLVMFGFTYFLYISIWLASKDVPSFVASIPNSPIVRGCVIGLTICVNICTIFYLINIAYATLKRIGIFCNCRFPLDCSTYAKAMNKLLGDCHASFSVNSHMQ